MQFIFEVWISEIGGTELRLYQSITEDWHVDAIQRRALALLWCAPPGALQRSIIVRRADTGREVFRKHHSA